MDQALIVFGFTDEDFSYDILFNSLSESLKALSPSLIEKINAGLKQNKVNVTQEYGKLIDVDEDAKILFLPTIEQFRNAFYKNLQSTISDSNSENPEEPEKEAKITVIYCGQVMGLSSDWLLADSSFNGEELICWLDGHATKDWLTIFDRVVEKRTKSPVEVYFITPECGLKTAWPVSLNEKTTLVSSYSVFAGKLRIATKLHIAQSGKINSNVDIEVCKNLSQELLKDITRNAKVSTATVPLRNRSEFPVENIRSMVSSSPSIYVFPVGDHSANSGISLFCVENLNVILNGSAFGNDQFPQSWPLISVMNVIDSVILSDWSYNNILFQRFLRAQAQKKEGTRFGPLLVCPVSSSEISNSKFALSPLTNVTEDDFQMNFAGNGPADQAIPKCQLYYCIGAGELYLQPLSLKAGTVLVWKNKKKIVRLFSPNNQLLPAGTNPSTALVRLVKSLSNHTKLLCSIDGEKVLEFTPAKDPKKTSTTAQPKPSARSSISKPSATSSSTKPAAPTTARPTTARPTATRPTTATATQRPTTAGPTKPATTASKPIASKPTPKLTSKPTTSTVAPMKSTASNLRQSTNSSSDKSEAKKQSTASSTTTKSAVTTKSSTTSLKPTNGTTAQKKPVTTAASSAGKASPIKNMDAKKETEKKTINSTLPKGIPTNLPPSRNHEATKNSILEEMVAVDSEVKPFMPSNNAVTPVESKKPIENGIIKHEEDKLEKADIAPTKASEIEPKKEMTFDAVIKEEEEKTQIIEDKSAQNKLESIPNTENGPVLNGISTDVKEMKIEPEFVVAKKDETMETKVEEKPSEKDMPGSVPTERGDEMKGLNPFSDHLINDKVMNQEVSLNNSSVVDKTNPFERDDNNLFSHNTPVNNDDITTSNIKSNHESIPSVGTVEEIKITDEEDRLKRDEFERDSIEEEMNRYDNENVSKITDSHLNDSLDGIDEDNDQVEAITSTSQVTDFSESNLIPIQPQQQQPMQSKSSELTPQNLDDLEALGIYENNHENNEDNNPFNKESHKMGFDLLNGSDLAPIQVQAENLIMDEASPIINNNHTNGHNNFESPNSDISVNSVVMQSGKNKDIGFEEYSPSDTNNKPSSLDHQQMPMDKDAFDHLMKENLTTCGSTINSSDPAPYPDKIDFFNNDHPSQKQDTQKQTSVGFEAYDEKLEPQSLPPPKPKTTASSANTKRKEDVKSLVGNTSLIGSPPTQLPTPLPQTMLLEVFTLPGYIAQCPLTLIVDFFTVVRAKIYILTGAALHPNVGEALLKAKTKWDEKIDEKWLGSEKVRVQATDEPPNWIRWLRLPVKMGNSTEDSAEDMVTGQQRLIAAGFEVPPAANLCDIQLSSGDEKIITPGCRFEL